MLWLCFAVQEGKGEFDALTLQLCDSGEMNKVQLMAKARAVSSAIALPCCRSLPCWLLLLVASRRLLLGCAALLSALLLGWLHRVVPRPALC